MSSIDERVVQMKFDNGQFERGVKETSRSLDSLKKGLNFDGAKKSLSSLASAGKNFTMGNLANGVQTIASKFSALGIVGVTALANIANRAVDTGVQLVKSLTIDPIKDGLEEYELNLNSIQTILANTQSKGSTLEDVNGALAELNTYADQTIYNFAEMSRNIGTFTAAGVDLDTSTAAIKGIANLAALSGSNSQQASTAMYQLSQAMSSGTVRLMDWNSVVNAGMGGEVFQNALIETARNQGISVDDFIKKNGSFRESLQEEWLTTEVMTETLAKFTGDLSTEQLKQMGYTDDQIKEIEKLGQTAKDAATKVKTMSQLLDTLKEAVGSGWAQTWQLIFGDFEEAKEVFTAASEALGGIVDNASKARNDLVGGWKDLGGRDVLIESVANAFNALLGLMAPIKEAFQEIFPPITAQTLYDLTVKLRDFTATLKMGDGTIDKVKRTFKGVFAILGIGWEVLKGVLGLFGDVFGIARAGSGSFLDVTASIGDFLVALHETIKQGGLVTKVFKTVGTVVKVIAGIVGAAGVGIWTVVKNVGGFIKGLIDMISGNGFSFDMDLSPFKDFEKRFSGLVKFFDNAIQAAKNFGSAINQIWNILARGDFVGGFFDESDRIVGVLFTIRDAFNQVWNILAHGDFVSGVFEEDSPIVNWLFNLREAVVSFFEDFDFDTLLDMFNTGLFAGMFLIFKKFFDDITGLLSGEGGGFLGQITEIFDGITGSLEAMQTNLKANTLLKIAGAIGILAAAILVISMIDAGDLTKSLTAITVMFTQLGIAMLAFEKIASGPGIVKMPILATSMILLSVAINILALAVRQMSGFSWEELAKGLTGVGVSLGLLAGWAQIMSKQNGSLVRASAAMILVGAALKVMASAVEDFSGMSWESMLQGLAGVGGALLAVAGYGALGGSSIKGAAAMVIVAAALKLLMGPLNQLGNMDSDVLIQALIGLGGALLVMAGGMYAMTGTIAGAASMIVATAALWVLVPLLIQLGTMSWNEIAKAATILAGSLLIIAGGMYLMTGIIAGAASMLVAVAALWVLVPLLLQLGAMDWESIGKACAVLAASLAIIAGGMYLMTGALPGAAALIVVAGALAVLTPVLLALSQLEWGELLVALAALAGAFTVLGVAGLLLAPVIPTLFALGAAITLLGVGTLAAGVGVLAFATGLTALGTAALVSGAALVSLFKQVLSLIPFAMQQIGQGIVALANVVRQGAPAIVGAIVAVLQSILRAIRTIAPDIINTVVVIVQAVLRALRTLTPDVMQTAVVMFISILNAIDMVAPRAIDTLWRLVMKLADTLQRNIPVLAQKGANMIMGLLQGLQRNIPRLTGAATNVIITFLNSISRNLPRIIQSGINLIINFVNGLARGINNNQTRLRNAAKNLARAIINGLTGGLWDGVSRVTSAARDVAQNALNGAKNLLGINSPSKEFIKIGEWSSEGFANGLNDGARDVGRASEHVGSAALEAMRSSMQILSAMVDEEMDASPTIRPVMDLSDIQKGTSDLSSMFATPKSINVDTAYGRASSIAADRRASNDTLDDVQNGRTQDVKTVNFYQTNNSPKALSTVDIYRKTRNLVSTAKGV